MGSSSVSFYGSGLYSNLQVVLSVRSKQHRAKRRIQILKSLILNNAYGPNVYGKLKRKEENLKFFLKIGIQGIGV